MDQKTVSQMTGDELVRAVGAANHKTFAGTVSGMTPKELRVVITNGVFVGILGVVAVTTLLLIILKLLAAAF